MYTCVCAYTWTCIGENTLLKMYITRAVVRLLVTVGEVVCNPLSIPSPKKTYPRYRATSIWQVRVAIQIDYRDLHNFSPPAS